MLPDLRMDRGRGCRLSRQPHRRPARWLRNRPISPDGHFGRETRLGPDQPRTMDIPLLCASPITWACRPRMVRPRAEARICRAPLVRPAPRHRGCPVLRHFVMPSPAIACRCSRRRPRSHCGYRPARCDAARAKTRDTCVLLQRNPPRGAMTRRRPNSAAISASVAPARRSPITIGASWDA